MVGAMVDVKVDVLVGSSVGLLKAKELETEWEW